MNSLLTILAGLCAGVAALHGLEAWKLLKRRYPGAKDEAMQVAHLATFWLIACGVLSLAAK